jgi:hypothetical protein
VHLSHTYRGNDFGSLPAPLDQLGSSSYTDAAMSRLHPDTLPPGFIVPIMRTLRARTLWALEEVIPRRNRTYLAELRTSALRWKASSPAECTVASMSRCITLTFRYKVAS